jgi:hypothetical protein
VLSWPTQRLRAPTLAALMLVSVSAAADECDARAERTATEIGATVRARIGPAIKMSHPDVENLSVDCTGPKVTRVSGSRDTPDSIAPFGLLLARTASLGLGGTPEGAINTLLACSKAAASRAGTIAEASGRLLKVKCYVLRSYVTFDVTRR